MHFIRSGRLFLVLGTFLVLSASPAYAGLLSITDELVGNSAPHKKALNELLANDDLYKKMLSELVPDPGKRLLPATLKDLLKRDLLNFVSETSSITWHRTDLLNFLKNLVTRKCSANVSCSVAFDLGQNQLNSFLDEITMSIQKTLTSRMSTTDRKLAELYRSISSLPPQSSARVAKWQEVKLLLDEVQKLQKYDLVASKLGTSQTAEQLTELSLKCR